MYLSHEMTLDQLIEQLEELRDDLGGEAAVRLASQPAWPFEHSVLEPVVHEGVVYLPEGAQLGYLAGEAANLAWGER